MDPNSYTVDLLRHARRKGRENELRRRAALRSRAPDMEPRRVEDFERRWAAENPQRGRVSS